MLTNRSTLATILGVTALGIASKLKKGSANEGKTLIFSSFEGMRNWIKEEWGNPEEVTVIHLKDANIIPCPKTFCYSRIWYKYIWITIILPNTFNS